MIRLSDYLTLPMILVLAGGILGAVGAFIATYKQNQEKAQAANQRALFEGELRAKSDEIAELNKQIAASVTGGDNYCHIEFIDVNQPNAVMLAVINEGNLPAYDVVVKIVDVLKVSQLKQSLPEHLAALSSMESMFQKTLGNVPPKQSVVLSKNILSLPEGYPSILEIHIDARNGTVAQVVRFERVGAGWTFATKATLLNDSKVLWQQIGERYSQKNIDDPNWWKIPAK